MLPLISGTLLLICIIALVLWDTCKPNGFPPGPKWFPLIGCYPQFSALLRKHGFCHLVWEQFTKQFGSLVGLRLGKDRIVLVSGFEAVKHVSTRDDCDGRPDGFFFRLRAFQQRLGLAIVDGEFWKEQRKFATRHMRNLGLRANAMDDIILREVEALLQELKMKCAKNQKLEMSLHDLFDISILNGLWVVVAGKRFELQDKKLMKIFELQHASFRAADMSGGLLNQMPFLRFVAPEKSGYSTFVANIDTCYSFLRETLEEHKKDNLKGEGNSDFIDAFLGEKKITKSENFHDLQLLTLCLDLFIAGSETTSNTLSLLMTVFLEYPEMQTRVQAEIDLHVGRERLPTTADKSKLLYLEALIMEAQRLMTVAPTAIPHRTMQDCKIMGFSVPKDTTLLMSIWSVHMDPEYWVEPEKFNPLRFLNDAQDAIVQYERFIPFGLGKRRCLGETLARNNLFLYIAGILQTFNISPAPGGFTRQQPFDGVTLSPKPFSGIFQPR